MTGEDHIDKKGTEEAFRYGGLGESGTSFSEKFTREIERVPRPRKAINLWKKMVKKNHVVF